MSVNFIWDMDGTLIDSYDSIVDCIAETLNSFDIHYDRSFIRDYIQRKSTSHFFKYVSKENSDFDYEELWKAYNSIKIDLSKIVLMPNAKETLKALSKKDATNYIFTHRGKSVYEIVKNLDIEKYFIEIVSVLEGHKRKPDPEAINYLVDKYKLDKNKTFYVGDRLLDQQCAKNANIGRIYYHSFKNLILNPDDYDYKINDLLEIVTLADNDEK